MCIRKVLLVFGLMGFYSQAMALQKTYDNIFSFVTGIGHSQATKLYRDIVSGDCDYEKINKRITNYNDKINFHLKTDSYMLGSKQGTLLDFALLVGCEYRVLELLINNGSKFYFFSVKSLPGETITNDLSPMLGKWYFSSFSTLDSASLLLSVTRNEREAFNSLFDAYSKIIFEHMWNSVPSHLDTAQTTREEVKSRYQEGLRGLSEIQSVFEGEFYLSFSNGYKVNILMSLYANQTDWLRYFPSCRQVSYYFEGVDLANEPELRKVLEKTVEETFYKRKSLVQEELLILEDAGVEVSNFSALLNCHKQLLDPTTNTNFSKQNLNKSY